MIPQNHPLDSLKTLFVLPMSECIVCCTLNVLRVSKKSQPSADCKIGSSRKSILPGPRVNGFEENSVRFEQIEIGKPLALREVFKSGINAGHERRMLKVRNDLRVFFFGEITQVTLRFKITEWVECHCLASRR